MVEGRCAFCASYKIECSDFKTEIHKIISKLHHRQLFHNSFRDLTLLASLDLKGVFFFILTIFIIFETEDMSKKALESFWGNLNYHICIMNSRQHLDYLKRTYIDSRCKAPGQSMRIDRFPHFLPLRTVRL